MNVRDLQDHFLLHVPKKFLKREKKTCENQTTVLMRNIPVLYKVQILFFTDNYLAHLNTLSLSLSKEEWKSVDHRMGCQQVYLYL